MKVAHRDLKLENILVDCDLTLKIADFGYASFQKVDVLQSYRGTFTYMAPEIKEGRAYNGLKVDLFSAGVILFILIRGIFPFKEARKEEFFYSMLVQGKYSEYWDKVQGGYLSAECKDLLQRLLSYDSDERPSIEDIKNHPWVTGGDLTDSEAQLSVVQQIQQAKQEQAEQKMKAQSNKKAKVHRGGVDDEDQLKFITQAKFVQTYKFNNFGEFLTEEAPSEIFDLIDKYRQEIDNKLVVTFQEDKKRILIEDKSKTLKLSLKFFKLDDDDEED